MGIGVAYLLGSMKEPLPRNLLARRIAHLAVAAPPLFVQIGVVFYLLHSTNGDSVFWWILWLPALAASAWAMRRQGTDTHASTAPNSIPLRVAHVTSALLIVLIFLAWHLLKPRERGFDKQIPRRQVFVPSSRADHCWLAHRHGVASERARRFCRTIAGQQRVQPSDDELAEEVVSVRGWSNLCW